MGTLIKAIKYICGIMDVESQRGETIMSEAKLTKEQLAKREQYGICRKRITGTVSSNAYVNIDKFLKAEYQGQSISSLAKEIGVDRALVSKVAVECGLKKSYKYKKKSSEVFIRLDKPLDNYAISNLGNVIDIRNDRLKKPKPNKRGYLVYSFEVNGKAIYKLEHRLIAEKFIDNPENKPEVNHIDGVVDNNSLDNLEWVTHAENMEHAHYVIETTKKGAESNFAKISAEQAIEIIKLLNIGLSPAEIKRRLPYATRGTVYGIRHQGNWRELDSYKEWLV